jgi:hypothetical protein
MVEHLHKPQVRQVSRIGQTNEEQDSGFKNTKRLNIITLPVLSLTSKTGSFLQVLKPLNFTFSEEITAKNIIQSLPCNERREERQKLLG